MSITEGEDIVSHAGLIAGIGPFTFSQEKVFLRQATERLFSMKFALVPGREKRTRWTSLVQA